MPRVGGGMSERVYTINELKHAWDVICNTYDHCTEHKEAEKLLSDYFYGLENKPPQDYENSA